MDRQTADAVTAPDGTVRGGCKNEARGNSTAPSRACLPALAPLPDAVEGSSVVDGTDAPACSAVACPVKSASEASTEVTAGTAAIAPVGSDVIVDASAPPRAPGANAGGAAGSSTSGEPPAGSAGDRTASNTQPATDRATHKPATSASLIDTHSLVSANTNEVLLKKSLKENKEAKNSTSGTLTERPATARHRRNNGRVRPLAAVGNSETIEGVSLNSGVSMCNAATTGAVAAGAMTRAGSSSGNVHRREQEKVKRRYEAFMRETEEALQKVLLQGVPEAETLTHPQIYLQLKKNILSDNPPPAEDPAAIASEEDGLTCREAEDESNVASFSRVKRLLRALCEGSSLPLSKLIHAVRVVLLDETDGAPREDVSPATLRSLIPVLLARRSLGIPPRRAPAASLTGSLPADQRPSPPAAKTCCGTVYEPATSSAVTNVAHAACLPAAVEETSIASEGGDISLRTHSSSCERLEAAAAASALAVATTLTAERAAGDIRFSSAFPGNIAVFDRNEDTTASCLWVWESAFLEGLPPAFKEKVKRDREKRAVVSRRVRSLLRLQQAIDQGIEKEIFVAQEKVAALEKKQQQEEERRREQQLKKRRAEEARLEKEREKKQKEDARREKEKERKKIEEQLRQTLQQSAGTAGGGVRSQIPTTGKTDKPGPPQKMEKKKEPPPSMLNQQLLMASWLTRKPLSSVPEPFSRELPSGAVTGSNFRNSSRVFPASNNRFGAGNDMGRNTPQQGGHVKDGRYFAGIFETGSGCKQNTGTSLGTAPAITERSCFPRERTHRQESSHVQAEIIEVGEDAKSSVRSLETKAIETARARAAAEAALWRVPEGKRHQFVERVLNLPRGRRRKNSNAQKTCNIEKLFGLVYDVSGSWKLDLKNCGTGDIDDTAALGAAGEYLKAFVASCAVPHSEAWTEFYTFFATHRQYLCRLPTRGGVPQLQTSSNSSNGEGLTHTYCQEMREVRKALALTDYVDVSLPDLGYLRTVVINLDEWKRPVRRLLLGKCAKESTAWRQCVEESCIDYDRDSDEEWFETFDVDDLDDGREEEEEEDQEADEDKDWLVDDDEEVEGLKAGSGLLSLGIRFESLCDWRWTFEGEEKPNFSDVPDACAIPTVQDPGWLSIYGCVVDDWRLVRLPESAHPGAEKVLLSEFRIRKRGFPRLTCPDALLIRVSKGFLLGGQPFSMLEATGTLARGKLTDEELCSLFKFCHGKTGSRIKLLAQFQKKNQHIRKSDLEKNFKEYMTYERRGDDRCKRWYVSCKAPKNLNLEEELDAALETARASETLGEAAQSEFQGSPEVSAASVLGSAMKQSQSASSCERTHQAGTHSDDSPNCTMSRRNVSTDECSLMRTRFDGVGKVSVVKVKASVEAGNHLPTLFTSSPAEGTISSLWPTRTLQESMHDEGTERRRRSPQIEKRMAPMVDSVPSCGSATPDSCSAFSLGGTSVTVSPSFAGSTSSMKSPALAPGVSPAIAQSARDKFSAAVAGATGIQGNNFSEDADRVDLLHTVDPFASAAATAALAASSAQAAAAAAYEKRPADSASARRVALAALMAAKLAEEVALQMSDSIRTTGRFGITRSSSGEFFDSPDCRDVASKSSDAQDREICLQSIGLRKDADRSSVSSTFERIAGEENNRSAVAMLVQASPVSDGTSCYQQRFQALENVYCSVLKDDAVESTSGNTLKRRKSDGSVQSFCGSSDSSACSGKRVKRPSCPSNGALPASAGSQVKNALITKYFKAASQGPRRVAYDATDDFF